VCEDEVNGVKTYEFYGHRHLQNIYNYFTVYLTLNMYYLKLIHNIT